MAIPKSLKPIPNEKALQLIKKHLKARTGEYESYPDTRKKFIKSSDEERQKFIGLHVGSFVIREWNPGQRYLQVGCHRFYEQTLKEFADYCEKGK